MPSRAWFYAEGGQQQGPFQDAQFRDLIGKGIVRADTLIWTDGMAGWQRAGDIPGLFSAAGRPPPMPGRMPAATGGGGSLSADFEILDFVKQGLIFFIGSLLIIPLPWVLVSTLKWVVAHTRVPGRPELAFVGKVETIMWWYFGGIAAIIILNVIGGKIAHLLAFAVEIGLGWLMLRWFIANLAANEEELLGLNFTGPYWTYLGWHILGALSAITIVGWAWVYAAQSRWICRNIEGTRREILFKAPGLEILWRGIVTLIGCAFIIPIPWVMRWMMGWVASQIVLAPRDMQAA